MSTRLEAVLVDQTGWASSFRVVHTASLGAVTVSYKLGVIAGWLWILKGNHLICQGLKQLNGSEAARAESAAEDAEAPLWSLRSKSANNLVICVKNSCIPMAKTSAKRTEDPGKTRAELKRTLKMQDILTADDSMTPGCRHWHC